MPNKRNDWLATVYYNPTLSLSDMPDINITPDNTEFKTRDEYRNIPAVVNTFKNENGEFDEKKFNALYDVASQLYNDFENENYIKRLPNLLGHLNSQWDAPLDSNFINTSPHINLHDNENEISFGLSEVGHTGKSLYADKTALEIAESQKVVDYLTGEELDWTPEDKGGLIKGFTRPTIVLATWDEDGSEVINGISVPHKKGDLKYNKNGKPYTELLGDRNPSQKTVINWTDTFTRESSKWNKYDFFDSDDLEKSFVGVLAKTAFTVIPYFVPYLNYAWAAITASEALGRVLPVVAKSANGVWTGDPNNEFAKSMNVMQGALMRFDPTVTQKSKEHLLTFENLGNLVGMIGGQLVQQQAIASIPMLLNGMNATEKTAKWGRRLALDYMALTSAQDSYDTFEEAGASARVAGLAFFANMLALRGLMSIDYFRDNVFKHTYMDESTVRVPLFNASKKISAELIEEGEKATTAESANKFINKLQQYYHNTLLNGIKRNDIFQRMLSEGTEEVMEEVTLDLTKLGSKLTEAFGVDLTEGINPLDFNTDLKDIVSRYGMSFFGGMLGGAMFAGQQKYWNWLGGIDTSSIDNDDFKKLIYYIGDGKADEMRNWLDHWHKKGLLGSKNLTSKMSTIDSIDGTTPVMEQASSNNKLSQNDVVYNGMLRFVDTMENIVKSEGLYITPENIARVKKLGFKVDNNTLNADTLANSVEYSHFMDDYLQLAKDIVSKNLELKEAILKATVKEDTPEARKKTEENIDNSVEIANLRKKLQELRNKRDDFLNGRLNWKYATQGLFVLNDQINSNFGIPSLDVFARLNGKDISSISSDERELIENEYKDFQKKDGKYNVLQAAEVYRQLAVYLDPIFSSISEQLKDYNLVNEYTSLNYGQTEYNEILTKYRESESKLNELRNKEELTEDDKNLISDLTQQLTDSLFKLRRMSANPGAMLISAQNGSLIELGNILQNPNLTDVDWNNIYNGLVNLYRNYASNKTVLNGDTELEATYNRIRKDFNATPVISRIISYMEQKYDSLPTSDDEDPSLKNSVVALSDSTSKNDNVWFAYYADENTDYQRHIAELIKQLVDSVGVNNTAANNIYNQILQDFKDNTNVSESDVLEMLDFVLPKISGKNLYVLMQEFDALRKNVMYVPLTDILNRFFFNYTGRSTSLLDMIASEERRFADGENVLDYLIYNNQTFEDLKTMKTLLKAVGAVIVGASNKVNASINNFEGNPEKLAVLDEHTSQILVQQLDSLLNRIEYLLQNAEENKNRQLKAQEDIDKNMRSKFLKAIISPAFSKIFSGTFRYTDASGKTHEISPDEIWKEVAPTDLIWDTAEMVDESKLRKAENDFSQKMHNEMSKLPYFNDDKTLSEKLVPVFGKNLSYMQTTILGKEGTEIISQYALLNYILSMLGMESTIFNTQYKNTIAQDSFDFAPVYGQELAVKMAASFLARPTLFNAIIDAMTLPENISIDSNITTITAKHIQNRSKLYNMYIVPGSSGSGKSTGVIGTISAMLKDHPSHQWITLSKSKIIANNLADNIADENVTAYDWDTFKSEVFGKDFGKYKENPEDGHFKLEDPIVSSKTALFDTSKNIKILAVDEITLFTEAELDILSKWAKSRGILILALGDPLQNAAKVQIDRILANGTTRKESQNSGIEDCVYMSSPMLTASLRIINLAQKTNFENLYNRLYATYVESTKYGAWNIRQYDNNINTDDLTIEFYENPSVIFGSKITDNSDLISEARKKKVNNSVAIIYDESTENKYKNLDEDGITLVPYNNMQGREFDYVFVDVDWKEHSRLSNTYVSKYNAMRDFYTVTQRARIGGIVIDNGIKELLNIHQVGSNPKMNQIFEIDDNQKSTFKSARLDALSGLVDKEGFNNSIRGFISTPKPKAATMSVQKTTKTDVKPVITSTSVVQTPPPSSGTGTPKAEELPVSKPKPIPAMPVVEYKPTYSLGDNKTLYEWLYNIDGFTNFEKNNQHSLFNVVKKINPTYVFSRETYRNIVNGIGSAIRVSGSISSEVNTILRPLVLAGQDNIVDTLRLYLENDMKIIVNPLNATQSIVSSRFYNGEDFIELPLIVVNGIKAGIYNDKIYRVQKAEKGTTGEHISISRFKSQNPGAIVSTAAVLAMSDEKREQIQNSDDYTESTKELLLDRNNLSKIGIVFTDEPYIANNRFNGYLYTDDNGFILKKYDDVALMFTQKLGSLTDVVNYAKSMAYIKNPEHLRTRDLTQYANEPGFIEPSDIAQRVMGLNVKDIPEKGQERYNVITNKFQILDNGNISRFFGAVLSLANQKQKYSGIYNSLFNFLITNKPLYKRTNYDILEQNAIWAKVGDKSYIFEVNENSGLNIFSYNVNDNSVDLIDQLNQVPNIRNLFENYFGETIPDIQLVYHLYGYDKNGAFNEDKIQSYVDPNDQIYYVFKGISVDESDNDFFNAIEVNGKIPFKNGIYLNVKGIPAYGNESVWMAANTNVNTLMTDVQTIVYSQYAINDKAIVPFDQSSLETDQQLNSFVDGVLEFITTNPIIKSLWNDSLNKEELINIAEKYDSSTDAVISIINDRILESDEMWNSPNKLRIAYDGEFKIERFTDYLNWIEDMTKDSDVTIIDMSTLESHNFGIYRTGNGEYKIIQQENGKWEGVSFKSYESFTNLINLFNGNNEFAQKISPLKDYVYSLVSNYNAALDSVSEIATEYMYNNIADPDIAAIYQQINNYLLERLENNEC